MGGLLDNMLSLSPVWVLVVAGLLVFLEDAVFVGFVIPGETAAVLAGVATAIGSVPFWLAIVVVVAAAILGDTVGFEVGQHFFGPKLLDSRLLGKHRHRIAGAESFLRRRGGFAVFLGRFTAFFRAMMPALAGAANMRYRTFLAWNAVGGIVWGSLWVSVGHAAGASYHTIENKIGHGLAIALVVVVVLLIVLWRVRSDRGENRAERSGAEAPGP